MAFTAFQGMKPWSQLIMTAFVIMISFLAFFLISFLIAIPILGFNEMLASLSAGDYTNQQTIAILKYFQVVQSIGLFVIPPVIVGWLFGGNVFDYLQLNRNMNLRSYALAIISVILFSPFISFMGKLNTMMTFPDFMSGIEDWMRQMEDQTSELINYFIKVDTVGGLLFNIFMIAVVPAVGEEFLFRGVIQKIFTTMTKSYHLGIWISAILFSMMHLQFYGFVPRALLGALFGYMLVYSGSLWLPVVSHFINNFIGVLALHATSRGNNEFEKIANLDFNSSLVYMIPFAAISLIATFYLLRQIKREGTN